MTTQSILSQALDSSPALGFSDERPLPAWRKGL